MTGRHWYTTHTHTQYKVLQEKTTATPLRAYEEPEALDYWGWGWGPELAITPNFHIIRILWNV